MKEVLQSPCQFLSPGNARAAFSPCYTLVLVLLLGIVQCASFYCHVNGMRSKWNLESRRNLFLLLQTDARFRYESSEQLKILMTDSLINFACMRTLRVPWKTDKIWALHEQFKELRQNFRHSLNGKIKYLESHRCDCRLLGDIHSGSGKSSGRYHSYNILDYIVCC